MPDPAKPFVQGYLASVKSQQKYPITVRKSVDGLAWENLTDGKTGKWAFNHTDWPSSVLQQGEFILHHRGNPDQWLGITDQDTIDWLITTASIQGWKYQKRNFAFGTLFRVVFRAVWQILVFLLVWQLLAMFVAPLFHIDLPHLYFPIENRISL